MAYRFDGVDDRVEFAITPLNGYTFGAATFAALFKRGATSQADFMVWLTDADGTTNRAGFYVENNDSAQAFLNGGAASSTGLSSTTPWYLLAVTWSAASTTPRYHLHDGTSWSHGNFSSGIGSSFTVAGTSRIAFGARPDGAVPFQGDAVCCGIKKANSSDATVETLSPTSWSAWTGFGFDWLIGFDSSLETAGILQDQGSAGTGDETAITGTSAVSDPAGWSWATSATYNGSATVSLTDTITTAGIATTPPVFHGAATVAETVTIATAGIRTLPRMILVPRPPDSLVLVPRPPDSLVLTPR